MTDELRDERLTRLYREGATAEPPAALDAAILAAARAEVAPKPARRRAGWQRWCAPAGLAATVVLTVTLTLLVRQEQALREEALPPSVAPQAPAAAPAPKQEPVPPAVSPAVPAAPPAKAKAAPLLREAERRVPAEVAVPPQQAPALPAAAPPALESKSLQAAPAAADAVDMRPRREALRKEAAGAARTPEQWLEEIRRLRREGREAEADAALAEFRKAHPDYRLPDDLR